MKKLPARLLATTISILLTQACATMVPAQPDSKFIQSAPAIKIIDGNPKKTIKLPEEWLNVFADPDDSKQRRGFSAEKNYLALMRAEAQVVDLPVTKKYLQDISNRLLKQWPGKQPETPIVIAMYTHEMVNAYANSANEIYLSTGAMRDAESESDIAALIGHELAHILLGHFARDEYFKQQSRVLSAIKNTRETLDFIRSTRIDSNNGTTQLVNTSDNEKIQQFEALRAREIMVDRLSRRVFSPIWSRQQEINADMLGMDLATSAGYSPGGLINIVDIMQIAKKARDKRLKQLLERDMESVFKGTLTDAKESFAENIKNLFTRLHDAVQQKVNDTITNSHPNLEKRSAFLTDYLAQWYSNEYDLREGNDEMSRRHKNALVRSTFSSAVKGLRHSDLSLEALTINDLTTAKNEIAAARNTSLGNSHFVLLTQYLVDRAQGGNARRNSHANLKTIEDLSIAPLVVYDIAARDSMKENRLADSRFFIESATQRFGDNITYPPNIALAVIEKNQVAADEYYNLCKKTRTKQLRKMCATEYGDKNDGSISSTTKIIFDRINQGAKALADKIKNLEAE